MAMPVVVGEGVRRQEGQEERAGAVGVSAGAGDHDGADGGAGLAIDITGSSVYRAGGGGSGVYNAETDGGEGGAGNVGSGGDGLSLNDNRTGTAKNGTTNTGSGGGGAGYTNESGAGGSGVIILRVATAAYSETTSGSPTVSTSGSDTILVYNSSGTYTV